MSAPVKPSTVGKEVPAPATRAEALDYIGAMLADLNKIAVRHRLDTLAYLIEMARLQAMCGNEKCHRTST
jgi:hypothetical protein